MRVIGLPGNPVWSYVCGFLFTVPLIRALSGQSDVHHARQAAVLGRELPANDAREDYLRARLEQRADGVLVRPRSIVRTVHYSEISRQHGRL
jgi:molybdopterin molybdotransferase